MDTFPAVMERCFPGVKAPMNRQDWFAEFPNGSELWIGGLDDKERTEKILGKEYSTILLNEASQISWEARNVAVTRLAQKCRYTLAGQERELALKLYYDCNPPTKGHWLYKAFHRHEDPETRKGLADAGDYAVTRINPVDNTENLPADYIKTLEGLPERLKRRFLRGEYGEQAPGQLWTEEVLDRWRVMDGEVPDLQRVVVAVDPSGADDDQGDNDEIGIIVAGLGIDGVAYVLEDLTLKAGPSTWGKVATNAFERHAADRVVAEINYGGAMVRHVIQTARPNTPFRVLTASRGKVVRAEPIASLHEQGKIRLLGSFVKLEDELTAMTTHGYVGSGSPNRADAFVWAMSELFPGLVQAKQAERKPMQIEVPYGAGAWMT